MKIYISADIEGVAGITSWDEARKDSNSYQEFQEQFSVEVGAACEGALAAGATEIIVKDAHGTGRNIIGSYLPSGTKLIHGWSGHPQKMMQELDDSFDAAMMVGYHSAAGVKGNPLGHTFSSEKVYRLLINDTIASEFLCNTYIAYTHNVPVIYVSGDEDLCTEVSLFNPLIKTTSVSKGIGESTMSLQPDDAKNLIKKDVQIALTTEFKNFDCPVPDNFKVELSYKNQSHAYKASYYPSAKQKDATTVCFESNDYNAVLSFLLFVI